VPRTSSSVDRLTGDQVRRIAERFANEVRIARVAAGLSQRDVAARAGLTQAFVSQVERGRVLAGLESMVRLAVVLGLSLSLRLFPGDGLKLRDSGQMDIALAIRTEAHSTRRVRLEEPIAYGNDRRAADMILETPIELVMLEIERGLVDFQAQYRAAQLKRATLAARLGRTVRLVIALPDTRRNRELLRQHQELIRTALPISSRRIWAAIRSGEALGGDGLLWVRVRRNAASAQQATPHP
jgi:transcriptional regulator with XRE-family HTH domain